MDIEPVTVTVEISVSPGIRDDPVAIRTAVRDWLASGVGRQLPTRESAVVIGVCVSNPSP
jgi:hypothetical protein